MAFLGSPRPLKGSSGANAHRRKSVAKVGRESLSQGSCESNKHAASNSGEVRVSLTLVENEIEVGDARRNAHGDWGKKNKQHSACWQTRIAAMSADAATLASDGDCVAQTPANSTDICECGAVAHALDIRVTAAVPPIHVGRLQPGVSGLQPRHGRFVSVETPRSTDLLLTKARRSSEQFA